jgi:hypothetical protein
MTVKGLIDSRFFGLAGLARTLLTVGAATPESVAGGQGKEMR